jgi:hypothetical protein
MKGDLLTLFWPALCGCTGYEEDRMSGLDSPEDFSDGVDDGEVNEGEGEDE